MSEQKLVDVELGAGVVLGPWINLYGCRIGDSSRVGPFVEIQRGAIIGARVKVSSHCFICSGVTIEDEVFIGHHVVFTNDRTPRATVDGRLQTDDDWVLEPTRVGRGASIGSNATILCGITIGPGAMVGAGSVVTRDVPAGRLAVGNPARVVGPAPGPGAAHREPTEPGDR